MYIYLFVAQSDTPDSLASSLFPSPCGGCIVAPKRASDLLQGDQSPCVSEVMTSAGQRGLVYTLQTTQTRHSICIPCVSQSQAGHVRSAAVGMRETLQTITKLQKFFCILKVHILLKSLGTAIFTCQHTNRGLQIGPSRRHSDMS